jgi:hypothetical protein
MSVRREVEWSDDRIKVHEDGKVVAEGRWVGGRLVDRSGAIGDGSACAWEELEAAIREESEAYVRATTASAHDQRGVDVTQIDRMLSLSPLERLLALDAQRSSVSRLLGDVPRD